MADEMHFAGNVQTFLKSFFIEMLISGGATLNGGTTIVLVVQIIESDSNWAIITDQQII